MVKRLDTGEEIGALWVAVLAETSSQRIKRRAPGIKVPHVFTFSAVGYARALRIPAPVHYLGKVNKIFMGSVTLG
jgi:hypothetical protein